MFHHRSELLIKGFAEGSDATRLPLGIDTDGRIRRKIEII
jgi:hypothetical protein